MYQSNFIGIGPNPNGLDLPLGLGMELAQEPRAMEAFGRMSQTQKDAMIRHIQGAVTGEDARRRIDEAVAGLRDKNSHFS